jgi:hypothetical protein
MVKASTVPPLTTHLALVLPLTHVNVTLDTFGMALIAPRLVATVILSKIQMALSARPHAIVLMASSGTKIIARSTVLVSPMLSGP